MKNYIIDGNNLIGKIKTLNQIHKKNKKQSAEKLAFLIARFFHMKNVSVSLHFDGFQADIIRVTGINIFYSGDVTADEKIKNEIGKSKNPKNIILITSDSNLAEFGRVCSCQVIKSEAFSKQLLSSGFDEEKTRIEELNNTEEFKKLFGVK
ncbi:MAG: NYN domain-containing protein [Ignavibacteriaceae bacterium]|nr:NYN domain-containing protein [Ignavibacteriaceae bacterium]MCW9065926.1 NYN domain-containing protein [Ignavibacteriaceae bacterium]